MGIDSQPKLFRVWRLATGSEPCPAPRERFRPEVGPRPAGDRWHRRLRPGPRAAPGHILGHIRGHGKTLGTQSRRPAAERVDVCVEAAHARFERVASRSGSAGRPERTTARIPEGHFASVTTKHETRVRRRDGRTPDAFRHSSGTSTGGSVTWNGPAAATSPRRAFGGGPATTRRQWLASRARQRCGAGVSRSRRGATWKHVRRVRGPRRRALVDRIMDLS